MAANIYEKDTKKEPQPTPERASTEALCIVDECSISTFIATLTAKTFHMGKHTGLSFCVAQGGSKPSFSTFILTVNRFLRPFRDIARTFYEDRAEALLAVTDTATANIVVLAPPVCV